MTNSYFNSSTMSIIFDIRVAEYLKRNPERFDEKEKAKFLNDIEIWKRGTSKTISDEVYDFLVNEGIAKNKPTREAVFLSYLNDKYSTLKFKRVLDVGAGRMCKLSVALASYGNIIYAMDPKIRLSLHEARSYGVNITKKQFLCSDYCGNRATNISNYDHIVAMEPCGATEHIIREGLKKEVPFDISLCATPHSALNGKEFRDYSEWYEHLMGISEDVNIERRGNSYYASNQKAKGRQMEMSSSEQNMSM